MSPKPSSKTTKKSGWIGKIPLWMENKKINPLFFLVKLFPWFLETNSFFPFKSISLRRCFPPPCATSTTVRLPATALSRNQSSWEPSEPSDQTFYLEDHPRTCKWLGSPPFTSLNKAIWKGSHNPIPRGRNRSPWLTMHLLTEMILQVRPNQKPGTGFAICARVDQLPYWG